MNDFLARATAVVEGRVRARGAADALIRGHLCVHEARGLPSASDTYCVVSEAGNVLHTTQVAARCKEPRWHANVSFAGLCADAVLEVAVWRPAQRFGLITKRAKLLGTARLPLAKHADEGAVEEWCPLADARGAATGARVLATLECYWEQPCSSVPSAHQDALSATAGDPHDSSSDHAPEGNICTALLQPLSFDRKTASAVLLQPPPPTPAESPVQRRAESDVAVWRFVASVVVAQLVPDAVPASFDVYDDWDPRWFLALCARLAGGAEDGDAPSTNERALEAYEAVSGAAVDPSWPLPQFLGCRADSGFVLRMVHGVVARTCRIDATPARSLTEQVDAWAARCAGSFERGWASGALVAALVDMRFGHGSCFTTTTNTTTSTTTNTTLRDALEVLGRLVPDLPAELSPEEALLLDHDGAVLWLYSLMLHLGLAPDHQQQQQLYQQQQQMEQ